MAMEEFNNARDKLKDDYTKQCNNIIENLNFDVYNSKIITLREFPFGKMYRLLSIKPLKDNIKIATIAMYDDDTVVAKNLLIDEEEDLPKRLILPDGEYTDQEIYLKRRNDGSGFIIRTYFSWSSSDEKM